MSRPLHKNQIGASSDEQETRHHFRPARDLRRQMIVDVFRLATRGCFCREHRMRAFPQGILDDRRGTVYTRIGDAFAISCLLVALSLAAASLRRL